MASALYLRGAGLAPVTAGLLAAQGAYAQAAPPAPAQPVPTVAGTAAEPVASEEIIVTAQRRSERLQDVPMSITAVTAQSLSVAGINSTRDLAIVTPGLRIEAIGPYIQPSLRGITTSLTTNVNEPNVATYIDGIYQPSLLGAVYNLPDVEQIEVLKGPQGTLFGRNATGGAILISTMSPNLYDAKGQFSADYGSYDTFEGKAFVSLPIVTEKAAVSLTGYYNHSDGYIRNLVTGKRDSPSQTYLFRGKLRLAPWDGADFVLTGMYADMDDNHILQFTSLNGNAAGRPYLRPGQPFATGPHEYAFDTVPFVRLKQTNVSLRGTIDVGPGTLTTTTGYGKYDSSLLTDLDNTLVAAGQAGVPPVVAGFITVEGGFKAFSQELIYATRQLGRFQATVGGFYFNSTAGQFPVAIQPYFYQYTREKDESYAIFGELTFDLTDHLSLIGGLRYSHETRRAFWTSRLPGRPTGVTPAIPYVNRKSWPSTTPRASLRYKFNEDHNVYFTFSKGFKSGAFNANGLQAAPVDPEKITSYEVGFKSNITPAFHVDGAAFYYDYSNLQVSALIGSVSLLQNAAQARIKGLELNANWRVSKGLRLTAGGTYLDAKYNSFPAASVNVPAPNPACISGAAALGGNCTQLVNATGNRMIRAPKFSGNLTASYGWETGIGNFQLAGTGFHSSRVFYEVGNRVSQRPYTTLNATFSWKLPRSGVEFRLWGRNLTSRAIIESTTITTGGDEVVYAAPRSYGITAAYKF